MSKSPPSAGAGAEAPVALGDVPQPLRAQWQTLLAGAEVCLPQRELLDRLKEGRPLRVKIGCDPTAPDLHLGHAVPLMKLRQFQEFGHQVVFIIGDWTARIGDPSGKSETRPPLSEEQVEANAKTYFEQVGKILDVERTEIVRNNDWLGRLSSQEMVELMAKYTVARMLEREDFKQRFRAGAPIRIHEFLYPLAQGYDSVAVKADVEIGGTDQTFNLLVAREIQRECGMRPQAILTMPILEGLDGVNKMSKSLGNYVGISESPREMFGKLMSISDGMMYRYFELCLGAPREECDRLRAAVGSGAEHPRSLKARMAREIVARYHSIAAAQDASDEFDRMFREKQAPDQVELATLDTGGKGQALADLLVTAGLAPSKGEARRLAAQGGVTLNGDRVEDAKTLIRPGEYLVKVGKRRFLQIRLE